MLINLKTASTKELISLDHELSNSIQNVERNYPGATPEIRLSIVSVRAKHLATVQAELSRRFADARRGHIAFAMSL